MKKIKTIIGTVFSRPVFQPLFEGLLNFSLKALNVGEGHTVETSGEKSVFGILRKVSNNRKAVVFDVGAHTGEWFNLFKKSYNKESIVFCFEPSKESYQKLSQIKSYGFCPEKLAFGDFSGKVILSSENKGDSTSHVNSNGSNIAKSSELIDEITLDTYCSEHDIQTIDLLKMDVEGYELKVLKGADKMIKSGRIKLIQFEFGAQSEEKYSLKDFFDVLSDNYQICRILKHGYHPIRYHHYFEIMTVTNFIAIQKPKISKNE